MMDLTVCPDCRRDFVYPQEFAENGDTHWDVLLVCGGCGWAHLGTYDQATCEAFDDQLEVLADGMRRGWRAMAEANLRDGIALFVEALACDAILPEDF